MTLRTALQQGTKLLDDAKIQAPRLTAEVLLAHALHRDRAYLYAYPEQELREVEWIHYGRYLHERMQHTPTQYITKTQEFYGRPFYVTPDVLIPRPETEHLVELAMPYAREASRIVDVGTGSGAIAITLALEAARRVIAIDVSRTALAIARRNAETFDASVRFLLADSLSACATASVQLIVSNPPYISDADHGGLQPEVRDHEPHIALFSGPDGLEFYRRLIPEAARVLQRGGHLLMELGEGQSKGVANLFTSEWDNLVIHPDLAQIPRVLIARLRA